MGELMIDIYYIDNEVASNSSTALLSNGWVQSVLFKQELNNIITG